MSPRAEAMRKAAEQEANRHSVEGALRAQLKATESERDRLLSQLDIVERLEAAIAAITGHV